MIYDTDIYIYCIFSNIAKGKVTRDRKKRFSEEEEEDEGPQEQGSIRCVVEGKALRCEDFER